MITTRREFITTLTGVTAAWPWRIGRSEAPPRSAHDVVPSAATATTDRAASCSACQETEGWLDAWQRLPRIPLVRDQIPQLGGNRSSEWHRATLIACRIREALDYDFTYLAGTEPGTRRKVLPVLLFSAPTIPGPPDLTREPVYLLAHCLKRQAVRTFRLDRIAP